MSATLDATPRLMPAKRDEAVAARLGRRRKTTDQVVRILCLLATVIGLLNLELGRLSESQKTRKSSWTNRYLGQFLNWIKELS